MHIGVIGLNHKLGNVPLRGLFANTCEKIFTASSPIPCVLLSTCNRTEIYFSAPMPQILHSQILYFLREELHFEFEHLLYSYFNADCFTHLARVCSGLDSAIAAETAIQGQVREAYRQAMQLHSLPYELHYLFQKASKISKEIRQSLSSLNGFPSLEHAILQIGSSHFESFEGKNLLFIGASSVNKGILSFLKNKGLNMTLCNRTHKEWEDCQTLPWNALETWYRYDWVIVGTKSPHYLIKKTPLGETVRSLLIDLSMPANVDRRLATFAGITLMDIDKVNETLSYSRKQYKQILQKAEEQIESATRGKINSYRTKRALIS